VLGGVGGGFGIVHTRSFFGLPEIMAALIAKNAVHLIGRVTRWALKVQSISAFLAELGSFSILKLAFGAFHFLVKPVEVSLLAGEPMPVFRSY
jgi:hypothetical protein